MRGTCFSRCLIVSFCLTLPRSCYLIHLICKTDSFLWEFYYLLLIYFWCTCGWMDGFVLLPFCHSADQHWLIFSLFYAVEIFKPFQFKYAWSCTSRFAGLLEIVFLSLEHAPFQMLVESSCSPHSWIKWVWKACHGKPPGLSDKTRGKFQTRSSPEEWEDQFLWGGDRPHEWGCDWCYKSNICICQM